MDTKNPNSVVIKGITPPPKPIKEKPAKKDDPIKREIIPPFRNPFRTTRNIAPGILSSGHLAARIEVANIEFIRNKNAKTNLELTKIVQDLEQRISILEATLAKLVKTPKSK